MDVSLNRQASRCARPDGLHLEVAPLAGGGGAAGGITVCPARGPLTITTVFAWLRAAIGLGARCSSTVAADDPGSVGGFRTLRLGVQSGDCGLYPCIQSVCRLGEDPV